MGRRALRKFDPSLDLTRHYYEIDDLPSPFKPDVLFEENAPLEIEIGTGKGLFMSTASGDYPDRNFLGIELAGKYSRHAAARLAKANRMNAAMIHGDAGRLFQEMLPEACATAVHVYFPDPWWKKRHKKRRIVNASVLRNVDRVLKQDGLFHFWTDVEEYFQTSLELIAKTMSWEGPIEVAEPSSVHDLDYRTHFERRTRLHDLPVYRSQFRKVD